jgi:hypothetical protein
MVVAALHAAAERFATIERRIKTALRFIDQPPSQSMIDHFDAALAVLADDVVIRNDPSPADHDAW